VTDSALDATPATVRDYRPGTFALRDTWIPLVHSKRVHRRPVRRAIHGEPVFVWRRHGELHVTEDSPVGIERGRRRASAFTDGSGRYPHVDRYGYVWVWYGDPANASPDLVPNIPHIPVEGLDVFMQGSVVFDCSYELVCENLLDLTHADFLHSALTGDALSEHDEIFVESTSETVTMTRVATGRPVPKAQKAFVKGVATQDVRLVTHVLVRSGVCVLHGNFQPGLSVRMLHPCNPESTGRTRTPVTYNPKRGNLLARRMFPATAHIVGRQDNWAVKPQNARYVQGVEGKDLSSRFDRAGLRYRRVYQDLVNRQAAGDTSYLGDGDPGADITTLMALDD
jgi:phenylpropionate dioxygenase-like ring-hydroxylating dioxygenase large terminal subunit